MFIIIVFTINNTINITIIIKFCLNLVAVRYWLWLETKGALREIFQGVASEPKIDICDYDYIYY